jgi:hypothetical protein
MALDTFRNSDFFVLLPVLVYMDVGMAVSAPYVFLYVHAIVMLGVLLLVASFAGDLVDFCLSTHMLCKIGYLDMEDANPEIDILLL